MIRRYKRSVSAGLVLAIVLVAGAAQPAHAATTKQLDVVVVERMTSIGFAPPTFNYEGSAVDGSGQLWTFTESVTYFSGGFGSGPFAMQSGANALSGTVNTAGIGTPIIVGTVGTLWWYTVTGGQGDYADCTGTGRPVRQAVQVPLVPAPNEIVVESISFDLTCP